MAKGWLTASAQRKGLSVMDASGRRVWLAVLVALLAGSGVVSGGMFVAGFVAGFVAYRQGWLCGSMVGIIAVATNPTTQILIQNPAYFHESLQYTAVYNAFRHGVTFAYLAGVIPTTALGGHLGAIFRTRIWDTLASRTRP